MATTEEVWLSREVQNYDRGSTYTNDGEFVMENFICQTCPCVYIHQ